MVRFGSARAGFVLAGLLMAGTALVPPAHAASYLVDTDLGTINGIGTGGSLNGTQFVVQQSAGATQFIFNGDLNIGTFDSITGTGSNFASFKALNNANIAPGAIFISRATGRARKPVAGLAAGANWAVRQDSARLAARADLPAPLLLAAGQAPVSTSFRIPPATPALPAMPEALAGMVRSAATGSAVPTVAREVSGSTATPPPHQAARLALAVSPGTAVRRAREVEAVPTVPAVGIGRAALEVTAAFSVAPDKAVIPAMRGTLAEKATAAETRVPALR